MLVTTDTGLISPACPCAGCVRELEAGKLPPIPDSYEMLAGFDRLDPLPRSISEHVRSISDVSVNAWLVARMQWYESEIRTDVRLAVQSALLVNMACTEGAEPHPLVEMLAHSDPVEIARDEFDMANRDRFHEAVLWVLCTALTAGIVVASVAIDAWTGL